MANPTVFKTEDDMNTVELTKHTSENSPGIGFRLVGAYYLLTIATGAFVLFFHGRRAFLADIVVGICYLAITALLYGWSTSSSHRSDSFGE